MDGGNAGIVGNIIPALEKDPRFNLSSHHVIGFGTSPFLSCPLHAGVLFGLRHQGRGGESCVLVKAEHQVEVLNRLTRSAFDQIINHR